MLTAVICGALLLNGFHRIRLGQGPESCNVSSLGLKGLVSMGALKMTDMKMQDMQRQSRKLDQKRQTSESE